MDGRLVGVIRSLTGTGAWLAVASIASVQPAAHAFASDLFSPARDGHVAYAAAMRVYRHLPEPAGRSPFLAPDAMRMPWTWVSGEGHSVLRRIEGSFLISSADRGRLWFREVPCVVEEWPRLVCVDGTRRHMAAPSLEILQIDDVEYRRVLPEAGMQ